MDRSPPLTATRAAAMARFGAALPPSRPASPAGPPGELDGNIAVCDQFGAAGWVIDRGRPGDPVLVQVIGDGRVLASGRAELFRPDLAMAGLGGGHCGFALLFDRPLSPDRAHVLRVCRAEDAADMPGSPQLLPSIDATPARLLAAAGELDGVADAATTLAARIDRLVQALLTAPAIRQALLTAPATRQARLTAPAITSGAGGADQARG